MVRTRFVATITVEDRLKEVWAAIPNKSAWVCAMLDRASDYALLPNNGHKDYRDQVLMCIPYGNGENCDKCMEEHQTNMAGLKRLWHERNGTSELPRTGRAVHTLQRTRPIVNEPLMDEEE